MTQPPVYATREDVMRAVDSKLTARNAGQIDRQLQAASRDVDLLCHRRFYPETSTRYFDWPNRQSGTSWILRLDSNELISATTLASGAVTIDSSDFFLRRADDVDEPPYTRIELERDSSAAFGQSSTSQRDIAVTGLFGYRNDETTVGALAAAVTTTTATTITVNGAASADLGIGSVLRIDDERMLVTGRSMADTGQNVGGAGLTVQANSVTLPVSDGTAFAVDEVLLLESERLLIVDIAGNTLTVKRAWDGSVLAAHAAGIDIYSSRTLTVTRGALGTAAATHSNSAAVVRWDPPALVRQLTIAQAIAALSAETSGYSKAIRSGEGSSERNRDTGALQNLRTAVYDALGRKGRVRAV